MKISATWLELEKYSYYKKEAEKVRLELIELIKEKDKYCCEISDQREWLNIVKKEINKEQNTKDWIWVEIKWLNWNLTDIRDTLKTSTIETIEETNKMSLTLNKSILELQSIQNEIEKERIELKQVKKDAKYAKSLKLEISSLENHKTLFEIQLQEKEEYLKIIEEEKLFSKK